MLSSTVVKSRFYSYFCRVFEVVFLSQSPALLFWLLQCPDAEEVVRCILCSKFVFFGCNNCACRARGLWTTTPTHGQKQASLHRSRPPADQTGKRVASWTGSIFTIPNRFGIGLVQPQLWLAAASLMNIYTVANVLRNVASSTGCCNMKLNSNLTDSLILTVCWTKLTFTFYRSIKSSCKPCSWIVDGPWMKLPPP